MSIVLYVGFDRIHSNYFTDFLDREEIAYNTEKCYLGYKITVDIARSELNIIIKQIIEFMIEFHLKDFILSKIYDEYAYLDVNDACCVMNSLTESVMRSTVHKNVENQLSDKRAIHIENYILFNIKNIMSTIYKITDDICMKMMYEKERKAFISMLRTYATLSSVCAEKADVEFTSEFCCSVSVDNQAPVQIESDKLLSFLTTRAPLKVNVKGEEYSPLLSGIILELFNTKDKHSENGGI